MDKDLQKEFQILPITEEHIERFHSCLDAVACEQLYLAWTKAPPLAAMRLLVRSNVANDIPQFVALFNQEVIGWCDISPLQREGFRHSGRLGMGVHQQYRRLGIGQQLLMQTLEKAKVKGLERIELEVFDSNTPAIHLCEKFGFLSESRKRKAHKLHGNYNDIIGMALLM